MKEDNVGDTCNTHGGDKNVYKILVGKHEGKKTTSDTYV
jgi:hypothetical protein